MLLLILKWALHLKSKVQQQLGEGDVVVLLVLSGESGVAHILLKRPSQHCAAASLSTRWQEEIIVHTTEAAG